MSVSFGLNIKNPLSDLIEQRIQRLQYGSYCQHFLLDHHPYLVEELVEPCNQQAKQLEEQLCLLEQFKTKSLSQDELSSKLQYHPHDSLWRMSATQQKIELIRRWIRDHDKRLKQAQDKTGASRFELRHLTRISLSPHLSQPLWIDLVLADIKQEVIELKITEVMLFDEIHLRLTESQMNLHITAWLHEQLAQIMRSLQIKSLQFDPKLFELYLQRLTTYGFTLLSHPKELYQTAMTTLKDFGQDTTLSHTQLCIQAYQQLADRQHHEIKYLAIAQHRQQLLESCKDHLQRYQHVDLVIQTLLGSGEVASILRQQAQHDSDLQDSLLKLTHQHYQQCSLLDWIGRLDIKTFIESQEPEPCVSRVSVPESTQHSAQQEFVGIHLGDELARLLPSELALISDPSDYEELELLFFQRFTEKRLNIYEQSEQMQTQTAHINVIQSSPIKRGPYIMCIDSSGSMSGQNELQAKALAFHLAMHAYQEQRACYVIQFAIDTMSIDLASIENIGALIKFLTQRFGGGTDLNPALIQAHQMLNDQEGIYKEADILIMSDFKLPELSSSLIQDIALYQEQGTRYLGVLFGFPHSHHHFWADCDARYKLTSNPNSCSLDPL